MMSWVVIHNSGHRTLVDGGRTVAAEQDLLFPGPGGGVAHRNAATYSEMYCSWAAMLMTGHTPCCSACRGFAVGVDGLGTCSASRSTVGVGGVLVGSSRVCAGSDHLGEVVGT